MIGKLKYLVLVTLLAAFSAVGLAGCNPVTSAPDAAALVVDRYCDKPAPARRVLRETVASAIRPHRIEVECAGDSGG